jgi:hypothetical protein
MWTIASIAGYLGLLTFILWPLLTNSSSDTLYATPDNFVLTDQRDRLVQMLKDLTLEKELGTISEADYQDGYESLSSELSQILQLLENQPGTSATT